jgi:hypothetical protein
MILRLVRTDFTDKETIGEMYVDDVFECFTLEDVFRDLGVKVAGETAIPYGVYDISITYSPRFGRYLPLLLSVPNFSGVRIHAGNTHKDTEGCLIVGETWDGKGFVGNSRKAMKKLQEKIQKALDNKEPVYIEITKTKPNALSDDS